MNFIGSDWCRIKELHLAYEQAKRNQCRIMPIVLRDCDWENIALEPLPASRSTSERKCLGELHTLMNPAHRLDTLPNPDKFYAEVQKAIRRMLHEIRNTIHYNPRESSATSTKQRSMFLKLGGGLHTWSEFIEVTSPNGPFWFGSRPLPLMRLSDQALRSDHPFIRRNQKQTLDIIGELCLRNDAEFRLPTSTEWRYAITVNGTLKRILRRPSRPKLEPCWRNYTANEFGIFAPCENADEWVMDKYDLPDTIASLRLGADGPKTHFRYDTGVYPDMQPAIRLICDSFPPSLSV